MLKTNQKYDDEIDLGTFFKIIWNGTLKLLSIVLISFIIGIIYDYK